MSTPGTNFRWSFSQWETYNGCPLKWKFQNILKLPRREAGPAAARGTSMHERVEGYIQGRIQLPHLLVGDPGERFGAKTSAKIHEKYLPVIDAFKNFPGGDKWVEKPVAFDSDWHQTAYKAENAWLRGYLDAARFDGETCTIGEWKSGKPKDTHEDQRSLYVLAGLLVFNAKKCAATTYYLEKPDEQPQRLVGTQESIPRLKDKWNRRVILMQKDKICAPKPSMACSWCDYSKRVGGPCAF